jgi:hypothetical protein
VTVADMLGGELSLVVGLGGMLTVPPNGHLLLRRAAHFGDCEAFGSWSRGPRV